MFYSGIEIPEINLDGFQVASGALFKRMTRMHQPSITIWNNSISFSKTSIEALKTCERIVIKVNAKDKQMLIVPVSSNDPDNIHWYKGEKTVQSRKIECKAFTSKLYEAWGLDSNCAYRATGHLAAADKKVMLLFDFNGAEKWPVPQKAN